MADGETPELQRLRKRIDALDRKIVGLLNERAELGREVGREKASVGRRAIRDLEREREELSVHRTIQVSAVPERRCSPVHALSGFPALCVFSLVSETDV